MNHIKLPILILLLVVLPVIVQSAENYDNSGFSLSGTGDYEGYGEEPAGENKRLVRAVGLTMGLVVPQSVRYWLEYARWIEDWQFNLTWQDQKTRFFTLQAQRFDSNPFFTNWTHAISGAGYYNFARYHGLNQWESLAFETVFSLWWEYITEWREVISVNDNVFSGISGVAVGEPLFQLGKYFYQRKGVFNRILGTLFNPVYALSSLLEGPEWRRREAVSMNTLPRFDLTMGHRQSYRSGKKEYSTPALYFRVDTAINTIPGYGLPGEMRAWFKETLYSEIQAGFAFVAEGLEEYSLYFRTVLAGGFYQKLKESDSGGIRGLSLFWGLGSAFDLYRKKGKVYYDQAEYHVDFEHGEILPLPLEFADKMAILNLAGPVLDVLWVRDSLRAWLSLGASVDFALVNAQALNMYSAGQDVFATRMKTTLSYYGYYYATGFTLHPQARLVIQGIDLEAGLKYQAYRSIQGLDRFQSEVEVDSSIRDSRLFMYLSLGLSLPRIPVGFEVAGELVKRRGVLERTVVRTSEVRAFGQLVLRF